MVVVPAYTVMCTMSEKINECISFKNHYQDKTCFFVVVLSFGFFKQFQRGLLAHTFNPGSQEAEVGRSL